MTIFTLCAVIAAESYLLGSMMFGILISKNLYHDDIRTHGSGSAGMTNMLRTFGKKADKKRKLYNGMLKCDLFMYL